MLTIRHIDGDGVTRIDYGQVDEALARGGYVWLDFESATPEEAALLDDPGLGLDRLLIEDVREDRHLPKLDVRADQVLMTVHALDIRGSTVEITTIELDVVLKDRLLLTWHEPPVPSVGHVGELIEAQGGATLPRPVVLLHRILDVMNDVFVPFVDLMERRLDVVEDDILTDPTEHTRREIYELQRDVIQLRRVVVPQAEVIRRLWRDHPDLLAEGDEALLRDVHDHLYRMAELSDSYRQLLDSAMDNYRSALNDDLNEMLKVLTMFSATLLPISVLAGIYGMNFEHMPELDEPWAYPAVWGLFAIVVTGLLLWFRSRGWIGRAAERAAQERRRHLSDVLEIPVLGEVLKLPAYGARAVITTGRTLAGIPAGATRRLRTNHASDEEAERGDQPDERSG